MFKELTLILHKLFPKKRKEETPSNSFCKRNITLL